MAYDHLSIVWPLDDFCSPPICSAEVAMSQFLMTKSVNFYETLSCDWSVAYVFVDNIKTDK